MKYTTKDQMNKVIYQLRDSLGEHDPFACGVTGKDWNNDKHDNALNILLTIRRLANKHHRLAEMGCNGEGVIRGVHYYSGAIDDYAKRTYGYGVKSSYLTPEDLETGEDVFDKESVKVEAKIKALTEELPYDAKRGQLYPWRVEFQGDPRGNTVKLYYQDRYIDINF